MCAGSTPRSRCSCNGTITRCTTTGGRARRCRSTNIEKPVTNRATRCCWRRGRAGRFTSTCRCARPRPKPAAKGMAGPPRGRQHEVADLLSFVKHAGIRNTVWLTADVHYTAAHYYDPNKAAFQDFEPFWEFVSGPIHAGTFGPNDLDSTFGPQLMYIKAPSKEQGQNLSPALGLQFFGHVAIDGETGLMTVTLKDVDDRALWSTKIDPKMG